MVINAIWFDDDRVVLERIDRNGEPLALNDWRFMKRYVVAVGWHSTIISRDGMRPFQGTPERYRVDPRYRGFVRNRKAELQIELQRRGDEPIRWLAVYAHSRRDAVRCFAVDPAVDKRTDRVLAGLIQSRRSRATGTTVNIYRAADAGLDPAGGDWATVCEDHGAICNHETLAMARAHAPWVEWCEVCQGV